MVYANRPRRLAVGMSKVMMAAFATGAVSLAYPTIWQLSATMDPWRLSAATILDPGAPHRWVGSSSMEGVGPAASVVTSSRAIFDLPDERMTDKDVVDQFLAAPVDSAESLLGGYARGEVPKPLRVTFVGVVKAAGGGDLRAGRPR